jgi:hypothetical protein
MTKQINLMNFWSFCINVFFFSKWTDHQRHDGGTRFQSSHFRAGGWQLQQQIGRAGGEQPRRQLTAPNAFGQRQFWLGQAGGDGIGTPFEKCATVLGTGVKPFDGMSQLWERGLEVKRFWRKLMVKGEVLYEIKVANLSAKCVINLSDWSEVFA